MVDNRIKEIREELEMTQQEIGYVFGVSSSTFAGWENGHDIIPLQKLVKLANMYKYSLEYIARLNRVNNYQPINKLNKTKIGKNLHTIRKSLNLTQRDIANECAISQTTYSNYEKGYYLISTMTLYTICKNHKISMDEILR